MADKATTFATFDAVKEASSRLNVPNSTLLLLPDSEMEYDKTKLLELQKSISFSDKLIADLKLNQRSESSQKNEDNLNVLSDDSEYLMKTSKFSRFLCVGVGRFR